MSVSTVLNRWLKRLYKLLAVLLVVFAVLISTLRLFLPYAHNYREDVEDFLNNSYNSNISIGSLAMGWGKSGPTLISRQVELLAGNNSQIYIDNLAVELDFWRSIRTRQWVTTDFVLSGAELDFEQVSLANSDEELDEKASEDNLLDSLSAIFLEQISRFSIRDSHVLYRTSSGTRAFTINELFWVNKDDRHRANGTVIVDGLSSNNLKVLLDFKGPKFDRLSGQAYLEANEIDITPWLGRVLAIKDANTHSAINFNAWLTVNAGQPELIQFALGKNEIIWQHQNKAQTFEVVGGDIQIKVSESLAFSAVTSPITVKRNGVETNKISLTANANDENIYGYINAIELASFEGISPLLSDDVGLEKLLFDLDAVGRVEDIYFRTNANDTAFTASFNDIDSHFSQGIPGIDNVSGELIYANNQLQISLNAVDGALHFDKHFKYPIPYTRLRSLINAKFLADGWQLSVEDIAFTSSQISLTADLAVNSVKDTPASMALLASVSKGDAKFAEYFYPHLLMGDNLVNYLNGAIIEGKVNQALVLFNGPLQSFPFNNNEGIFVVNAELAESTFRFDPEWPAIENFSANLNFTNNSMLITGREGTLTGIDVTGVEAAIADLAGEGVLTVDASFTQTQPQLVRQLMNASPMQDSVGATLDQVIVSAPIDGDFSLILPLATPENVIAKGHVDFKNNAVALQTPAMNFKQVNGRLDYHNDKITATGVKLDWRGMPLTINVTAQQKSELYNVNIETLGQWQTEQWQAQLPEELIKYVNGKVAWQGMLELEFIGEQFFYDYKITPNLDDVALALPLPFSKAAEQPITVNLHAFGDDKSSTINARVGNNINFYGLLEHQKQQFSLAHLVLGKQQSWLPTQGFNITADLVDADYQEWQPLVVDILSAVNAEVSEPNLAKPPSNNLASVEVTQASLFSIPEKIHGQVANLNVYGHNFQEINFDFVPQPNWWLLDINAKELRGSAKFYPDWLSQGIDIDADFIHLITTQPEIEPAANIDNTREDIAQITAVTQADNLESNKPKENIPTADTENTQATTNTNSDGEVLSAAPQKAPTIIDQESNAEIFTAFPPLKVACASCKFDNFDFGEVNFTITRENNDTLLLNNFKANRDKSSLVFDAKWQLNSSQSITSIKGSLATNNVAREIENIGLVSIIKDSGVNMDYNLTWQGGPHDFAMATLNGALSTSFNDGYLADVDDKGVRIFSFLSLQSLVRKLSFDFRDIFSDGMFYSELKGDFSLKDGVAYTDNVLMKGAAGDLSVVGNTNLNNSELDYRMTYKPNLTSSLPVLAWIATLNPVTFLAGVALDEVITSSVIAEINFEVTGNLDEPLFKQVSRKNKNISVGKSSPPKIVDKLPESDSALSGSENPIEPNPESDNFDGS